MSSPTPPRLAIRLLESRLQADEIDEILGDLDEQYRARAISLGAAAARRWYWRQALALAWGFSIHRRDVVSTAHERTRGRWAASNLLGDVRYGWRGLRRSPSFSLVAWLTLAGGIALSATVFSLANSVLIRPLPYAHADRLVRISEFAGGTSIAEQGGEVSDTAIGVWLSEARSTAALSPYSTSRLTVTLPDAPANVVAADVGLQFFSVLSAPPLAGRLLEAADAAPDAPPAVVISRRLWATAFHRAPDIVGRSLAVDGSPYAIVGVLPGTFAWPSADVDVWRYGSDFRRVWPPPGQRRNFFGRFEVIARLRESATLADAARDGERIARLIADADSPSANAAVDPSRIVVRPLLDDIVAPVKPALLTLGAGMSLVLIAGCVNLAMLLLARHTARRRELAVRLALGATRRRLARAVLVELSMLGAAGGITGAMTAWWMVGILPRIAPASVPRLEAVQFDVQSFLFVAVVSLLTVVIVGLLPVVSMPHRDLRGAVSSSERIGSGGSTRSADRIRAGLVVGQVGLAVVLLVGALLVGRSLAVLLRVSPGYQPDGVLTFQVSLPADVYRQKGRQTTYYAAMLERIARHPDVQAVAYAATLPMHDVASRQSVNVEGRPVGPPTFERSKMAVSLAVSKDYFRTLGTRILQGRGFTSADTPDALKVVLIDDTLRRRFFADEDPLGKRIRGPGREWWTIVGVVEAVHLGPLAEPTDPVIYFYADQLAEILAYHGDVGSGIAVRVKGDPVDLVPFLRDQSREVDATSPLFNIQTLNDQISESVAQPRFVAMALGVFAVLAVATALLGIYGLLAYSVERQRLEFGIRRALGATERHVVILVAGRGLALASAGAVLGLAGAAALSQFMRATLFGIAPTDAWSFGGAAVLALAMACAASFPPVRRALEIDPARALKSD